MLDLYVLKDQFTTLMQQVTPWTQSCFVMWLDIKVAEYKVLGHMRLQDKDVQNALQSSATSSLPQPCKDRESRGNALSDISGSEHPRIPSPRMSNRSLSDSVNTHVDKKPSALYLSDIIDAGSQDHIMKSPLEHSRSTFKSSVSHVPGIHAVYPPPRLASPGTINHNEKAISAVSSHTNRSPVRVGSNLNIDKLRDQECNAVVTDGGSRSSDDEEKTAFHRHDSDDADNELVTVKQERIEVDGSESCAATSEDSQFPGLPFTITQNNFPINRPLLESPARHSSNVVPSPVTDRKFFSSDISVSHSGSALSERHAPVSALPERHGAASALPERHGAASGLSERHAAVSGFDLQDITNVSNSRAAEIEQFVSRLHASPSSSQMDIFRPVLHADSMYSQQYQDDSASSHLSRPMFSDMFPRQRSMFSPGQLGSLEVAFKMNRYVTWRERKILAEKLNLSEKQVRIWFQNRRQKSKRTSFVEDATDFSFDHTMFNSAQFQHVIASLDRSSQESRNEEPNSMDQHEDDRSDDNEESNDRISAKEER